MTKPQKPALHGSEGKTERDPLCMAMLAAWLNITVDQIPMQFRVFTCDESMKAWQRVADAARSHLTGE